MLEYSVLLYISSSIILLIARLRRDDCSPTGGKAFESNSIHTLLCSDEHKNPPEDGLRENRSRPQHEAARCALSLGCKGRGFRDGFSEAENAKRCHPDATSCHLRQKRYNRHFFLVYLPYEPTTGSWMQRTKVERESSTDNWIIRPTNVHRKDDCNRPPNVATNRRWAVEPSGYGAEYPSAPTAGFASV